MSTFRFTIASLTILLVLFHLSTCSYVECGSGPIRPVADIMEHSGQLHNSNAHVTGQVTSTISVPGFRVYYLDDGTDQPMLVKIATGTGVPARGSSLSVCVVVHEVFNLNDAVKLVVLEEVNREDQTLGSAFRVTD